ncbi:MAG TPA: LCP family protein [Candidatus Moranbacteria bacterium]|nr:LCP family protein [Candidatus Moranbacteria bacterium]
MAYMQNDSMGEVKFYKKKWFKVLLALVFILVVGGVFFAWKTGMILTKISKGGLLSSIVHNIPGVKDELKGESEGRINIVLLGMRGEGVEGGGLLADTIMVISVKPAENKASIISVPRDLYVTVPGTQDKQKINAVHAYGEEKGKGKGLEAMKTVLGEVTGLPIHYAASINFAGFTDLIEAIGGIDIVLETPFSEGAQFHEPKVCDSYVYTVPAKDPKTKIQLYENKYYVRKNGTRYVAKSYPLCYNKDEECNGIFSLQAGNNHLDGKTSLCYARARFQSSDFERAKRQQVIIQAVKDKMTSAGTLSDFSKINGILDSLGDNVRTDMRLWEMQKFYDIYKQIPNPEIHSRVLEDSEEGFLYYPGESAAGYILLPRGDNYDKIHDMAQNIFTIAAQSDIKPK